MRDRRKGKVISDLPTDRINPWINLALNLLLDFIAVDLISDSDLKLDFLKFELLSSDIVSVRSVISEKMNV